MNEVAASPETGMTIRRPIDEVFSAFIEPAITSKFWFSLGSGPLVEGNRVEWTWDMYGFTAEVEVLVIEPNHRIRITWASDDPPTTVDWTFRTLGEDACYVSVVCSGISGPCEEVVKTAADSVDGHAYVLAGAKAWLEHGIELNLVPDRFSPE